MEEGSIAEILYYVLSVLVIGGIIGVFIYDMIETLSQIF